MSMSTNLHNCEGSLHIYSIISLFCFCLYRGYIETHVDIISFDNFSTIIGNLQKYAVKGIAFIFPHGHDKTKIHAAFRSMYSGIMCTNVENGDRNSKDKSGDILPDAFIGTKILPNKVQFPYLQMYCDIRN